MQFNKVKVSRGLLVSALMALIFIFEQVQAAENTVVINELMWDGTEYVELFNTTGTEIALSGWQMTRQQTGGEEKSITTFESEVIPANGYFLIEKKEDATTVASNKIVSGLTLVNTGELVKLKDSSGNVIDSANQLGEWFAGEDTTAGESMERSEANLLGTEESSWHTSTGSVGGRIGTPGEANTIKPVNHVPAAAVSSISDEVGVNEVATFSAEDSSDPDGDELTFVWDFGDGSAGSGSVVTHTFATAGNKTIQVTVSDGALSAAASLNVTVSTPSYSGALVVNEFLSDLVGSDTDNEFIELFNTGSSSVDLSGWKLDDAEGGSAAYVIPSGTTIVGGGYLSFTRAVTKLALNNEGDNVRLLAPDGSSKSTAAYDDSSEGQSHNRTNSGSYEESTTLTSGAKNIITKPVSADDEEEENGEEQGDFSSDIVVNELLPNPTGSDTELEFVELLNIGKISVNLSGWKLDDEDGGSAAHTIPSGVTIGAGKVLALRRGQTKLALNNDADSVRLLDPAGKEISNFTYEESVAEGISWARDSAGKYQLTSTVTEGKANVIQAPASAGASAGKAGQVAGASVKTIALKDIRAESEGTMVTTEGVVSAAPGVLGKGILYLAGSGVQVYFSEEDYPEVAVGDRLKVTGELGSYLGESRIKLAAVTDMSIMGKNDPPLPHQVKTGEIGEAQEGFLVVLVGRVTETSGDTFYVDDGSGAIKIFIKESTGIEKPKMKKGDLVTISGVVSQTSSGYRVLPRVQEDVRLGAVAGLKTFPGTGLADLWVLPKESTFFLALAALWLSVFLGRGSVVSYEARGTWRG